MPPDTIDSGARVGEPGGCDAGTMLAGWGAGMTLVTITPGPVLSVYDNGKLIVQVKLSMQEAVSIVAGLAKEIRV